MGRHFGGLCPGTTPFPCLDGCNTSYQLCAHLKPSQALHPWRCYTRCPRCTPFTRLDSP